MLHIVRRDIEYHPKHVVLVIEINTTHDYFIGRNHYNNQIFQFTGLIYFCILKQLLYFNKLSMRTEILKDIYNNIFLF